ncbi:MAG: molybdate ABC transporter substrate-binding protein [Reichenbachiella sp.]|uniref:molybdate ABC transporter substrate-binding protein n=1 Tax=Reichenbachiella sp. TaxID=2184521 RepID=UPI0032635EA1
MHRRHLLFFVLPLLFPYFLIAQPPTVRVALASSLMPAIEEIKTLFESQSHVSIELIPGASGTLANQIIYGAPYDIFISANKKYTLILNQKGLLIQKPSDWVRGKLVLWSDKKIQDWSEENSASQIGALLIHPETKSIAIAQPGLAPYGDAAKSYLNSLGLKSQIDDKLIYGNNISITNQYIYTRSANVVITSLTSKIALIDRSTGYWYPINYPAELIQTVGILQNSSPEASDFYDFLFTAPCLSILASYGYIQM